MRRALILFLLVFAGVLVACTGSTGSTTQPDLDAIPTEPEPDTPATDTAIDEPNETPPANDAPEQGTTSVEPGPAPTPSADEEPGPEQESNAVPALEPAFAGLVFDAPIELLPFDDARVVVGDQSGVIVLLDADGYQSLILDLRGRVSREGGEEGLLSLALDPSFASNGHLWAYYSAVGTPRTRLSRFTIVDEVAAQESELIVLEVPQPFRNHNGGAVRFGPDGFLYLGLGDGGLGSDPRGNGQDLGTLLGSILRLDVRNASPDQPYAIPGTNPFVGFRGVRGEIWAWGLRNPWRMSFDLETGNLWVGDVGQDSFEEINIVKRGNNLGWNIVEGDACFDGPCDPGSFTAPLTSYDHQLGCSVTGGMVVRRSGLPFLDGAYLYGDFCTGRIWVLDADLPGQPTALLQAPGNIASFGEDAQGNVYALLFGAPIMRFVAGEAADP